jgi:hypothetical protein
MKLMFIGWKNTIEICRNDFWEEVNKFIDFKYVSYQNTYSKQTNTLSKEKYNEIISNIKYNIEDFKPEHIVFGERLFRVLGFDFSFHTNIPISFIIDDWHVILEEKGYLKQDDIKIFLENNNIHKIFSRTYFPISRLENIFNKKIHHLSWAINYEKMKQFHNVNKKHDIVSIGTGVYSHMDLYPTRHYFYKNIPENLNCFVPKTPIYHDLYREKISQAKIFIFGLGERKGALAKCVEGMASSALVMHDGTNDDEILGYEDGKNYIKVNKDNFNEKIAFYLKNDELRSEIVLNANKLIKDRHTVQQRVQEFIEMLKNG